MKVVFNGVIEEKKRGCSVCGKRSGSKSMTAIKRYILPSGGMKTFRVGHPEEVSEADAEFLLSYQYEANGETKKVFDVWQP